MNKSKMQPPQPQYHLYRTQMGIFVARRITSPANHAAAPRCCELVTPEKTASPYRHAASSNPPHHRLVPILLSCHRCLLFSAPRSLRTCASILHSPIFPILSLPLVALLKSRPVPSASPSLPSRISRASTPIKCNLPRRTSQPPSI
jgi:hypothetical protein